MDELNKKVAIGWLCRMNNRNARAFAIRSVQEYAQKHFGGRLSEWELRRLSRVLCEIDDTVALHEAIKSVRPQFEPVADDNSQLASSSEPATCAP
jgi:hypothetical protein